MCTSNVILARDGLYRDVLAQATRLAQNYTHVFLHALVHDLMKSLLFGFRAPYIVDDFWETVRPT